MSVGIVSFFVPGKCQPKGSTKSFRSATTGHVMTLSDNDKLAPWATDVKFAALKEMNGAPPTESAVAIELDFQMARPKSRKRDLNMVTKPDVDKLIRATLDAMAGVVFADDKQVTEVHAHKFYSERPGVNVRVAVAVTAAERSRTGER